MTLNPSTANQMDNFAHLFVELMFFKWAHPGLFSVIFCLFKQTIQFLQQINVKKCPSIIWHRESNPRPFKNELSPITTRSGLPPILLMFEKDWKINKKMPKCVRLRLPSCGPGFESQAQHLHFTFFNLNLNCNVRRTKINKKETGNGPC